jgi:putative ABC transport system permease protein
VIAADDAFLSMPESVLDARADGYESDRDVLEAVQADETLALLDASVAGEDENYTYDWEPNLGVKDDSFEPFLVEFRDSETSAAREITVVGVLASKLDNRIASGLYVNEESYRGVFGEPSYERAYIRLHDGVSAGSAARDIEASLSTAGVQADSIQELLDDSAAQDKAFTRMFQAFMTLGLFVGVAALGVIAFRSVVERRQQIGMLRAIGYQSNTVALTFVLESGFIAVMGILSGVVGGTIVSQNLFTTGQFSEANVDFAMPWMEVFMFVAFAAVVSLLMTWWPSRRAAGVPVADALRYE